MPLLGQTIQMLNLTVEMKCRRMGVFCDAEHRRQITPNDITRLGEKQGRRRLENQL